MNWPMNCTLVHRLLVSRNAFNDAAFEVFRVYAGWKIWRIDLPGPLTSTLPFICETTVTVE